MEPEIAEWPWRHLLFSVTPAEETQKGTFYKHTSIVPVHMTPYQLGINWSSWMLMKGEVLFGCSCLYCFLLWTALGSVTGTRQWLNQRGHYVVLTGTSSYWRTLYWTSDFKTHLIRWQRPTNQMVEYVNKWQRERGKYRQKITERRRRRSNVLQTMNADGLYFVPDRQCSQPVDLSAVTLWP